MTILPIQSLTEVEQHIFGASLYNLSTLKRLDFPVPDGILVSAPEFILETIIKYSHHQNFDLFTQEIELQRAKWEKASIPQLLGQELGNHKSYLVHGDHLKSHGEVWIKLLHVWIEEIKSFIYRFGFDLTQLTHLQSVGVFFLSRPDFEVQAYYNSEIHQIEFLSDSNISPNIREQVEELIVKANKKLFIPHIYNLAIFKNDLWIIGLKPFTQTLAPKSTLEDLLPAKLEAKLVKSATKVFLKASSGSVKFDLLDGVVVKPNQITDLDAVLYTLGEIATATFPKPVIYQFTHPDDDDIGGALRLLNQPDLLRFNTFAINWLKDKKGITNLSVAIPTVRNPEELIKMKQALDELGVRRGQGLGFWLTFNIPENIVNAEKYLEVGCDGVIIEIDDIHRHFCGIKDIEFGFYKNQIESLIDFVKPSIQACVKHKVPVLVSGQLTFHHEILETLLQNGIWGIVTSHNREAEHFPEVLQWLENRMVNRSLAVS